MANEGHLGLVPWRDACLPRPILLPGVADGTERLAALECPSAMRRDLSETVSVSNGALPAPSLALSLLPSLPSPSSLALVPSFPRPFPLFRSPPPLSVPPPRRSREFSSVWVWNSRSELWLGSATPLLARPQ